MNDFSEELLSAYLDGELPAEERARVERWLAESPTHRRMFDDLQAIRRELQALPQQKLDNGFSQRVLEAIRHRSGGTPAAPVMPIDCDKSDLSDAAIVAEGHRATPKHVADAMGLAAWQWFAAGAVAALAVVLLIVAWMPGGALNPIVAFKSPDAATTEYSTSQTAPQAMPPVPSQSFRNDTTATPSAAVPTDAVKQLGDEERSLAGAGGAARDMPSKYDRQSSSGALAGGGSGAPAPSTPSRAPALQPSASPENVRKNEPPASAGADAAVEVGVPAPRSRTAMNREKKSGEADLSDLLAVVEAGETLEVSIELEADAAKALLAESLEKTVGLQLESGDERSRRFAQPSSTLREVDRSQPAVGEENSVKKEGRSTAKDEYQSPSNATVSALEFVASPDNAQRMLNSLRQQGRIVDARLVQATAEGELAAGKSARAMPAPGAPLADDAMPPPVKAARPREADPAAGDAAAAPVGNIPKPLAEAADKPADTAKKREQASSGYAGSAPQRADRRESARSFERLGGAESDTKVVRVRLLFVQPAAASTTTPPAAATEATPRR